MWFRAIFAALHPAGNGAVVRIFAAICLLSVLMLLGTNWSTKTRLQYSFLQNSPAFPDKPLRNASAHRQVATLTLCRNLHSQFPDAIPRLVHFTSKDGRVPAKLIPLVKSWRLLLNRNGSDKSSAGWQFMHWTDAQIEQLVSTHYPQLRHSFAKLVNGLEKSDIGRLVVLHHTGGLYVDMDVELLRDPVELLRPNSTVPCRHALWSQEPIEHALLAYNMPSLISNAVMFSKANHSFLNFIFARWPAWFDAKWAKKTDRNHAAAVTATGPGMLNPFYEQYAALPVGSRPVGWCQSLLGDPQHFQPVPDSWLFNTFRQYCGGVKNIPPVKQRHCKRLAAVNFQPRQIPKAAFTVHRFLHLSYTHHMNMDGAVNITDILPIQACQI